MTADPELVCVLAMVRSKLREALEMELSVDGYEVRCAESIAEVERRVRNPRRPDCLQLASRKVIRQRGPLVVS